MGLNLQCRVCGERSSVSYRSAKRQMLCESCDQDIPEKISRTMFEFRMWGGWGETTKVPLMIRDEFYAAYLSSRLAFPEFQESISGRPIA